MNQHYEAVPVEHELPEKAGWYHTFIHTDGFPRNHYWDGTWWREDNSGFGEQAEFQPTHWLRPVSSLPEDAVKKALPNKSSKDAEGEEDDICDECGNELSECKCERYFCDICNGTNGTHKKGCPNDDSPFAEMQHNGYD